MLERIIEQIETIRRKVKALMGKSEEATFVAAERKRKDNEEIALLDALEGQDEIILKALARRKRIAARLREFNRCEDADHDYWARFCRENHIGLREAYQATSAECATAA